MIRIRPSGFRSGALSCALAGIVIACGPLAGPADAAPERTGEAQSPVPWIQELGEYFEANPDLKEVKGSGWKPYNRYKWFTEQRMLDGQPIPPNARWNAWLEKNRRVAANPALRANTWFSLGPTNFGGRMLSMDFDPTNNAIVYAGGADGGVWKSTNSGTSWFPLSDELPSLAVGGLAVSKTNPNVIVACTGEPTPNIDAVGGVGILRSTDGGSTWITTSLSLSPSGNHGFHFAMCNANGTFLAGASDGLWRSSDDGATWVQKRVGDDYYDGVISPGDPNKMFVVKGNGSGGNNVKVTTNDGVNWGGAGAGQPASFVFGKSKLGISGTTIYCYIGDQGTGGGIFGLIKSTDDGANWVQPAATNLPSGQSWYNLVCAADPNNASRVHCGAVTMSRSNDGGASFVSTTGSMHVDQHVIKYEPNSNTIVWAGNDGGMYRSTSDGTNGSWGVKNSGLVTYQFYDICVGNNTTYYVLGGTQDNGTDRWTGTTTWTSSIGADGMVCNIAASDNSTAYGEIQFGDHRKSTNQGVFFSSFNSGITGNGKWVTPTALDPNDAIHLLTETSNGIFRSTNGSSWSNVASHGATWIDISPVNGNVAFSITGSFVHVTTDNGNSWVQNNIGFAFGGGTKIIAHPTDVNEVWATASSYSASVAHIAKSTNQGSTWTDHSGDIPAIPVNAIAIDPSNPGDIYVGTDIGVWFTRNDGVNWHPVGDATLPNAVVVDLEIRDADRKLVAGTHGRGAWELTIPAEIETGNDVAISVTPESRNLMLDVPTPNPASDRTLLRYAARTDAPVSLKIYDVNGRLVSDLEDFERGDGLIRTTPWFANDVPTGVYFAVLQAGAERKSQKITVIK